MIDGKNVRDTRMSVLVAAHLRDMMADCAKSEGLSARRIDAIARGEEATNDELDELGHCFVKLMRALKQV